MTNVLKHTDATATYANVSESGGTVCLVFQDNGKAKSDLDTDGYGLQGIKERVDHLSGEAEYGFGNVAGAEVKMSGFWMKITVPIND